MSSAYERKLAEMREYVPFLKRMIDKLERAGDRSKDTQLAKMKSLRQERRRRRKTVKFPFFLFSTSVQHLCPLGWLKRMARSTPQESKVGQVQLGCKPGDFKFQIIFHSHKVCH